MDAANTEQEGVSFKETARRLLKRFDEKESELAIYTGIEKLDEATGGFRPGELVVFVGSTGTGKTLLSQQTRRQACQDVSVEIEDETWRLRSFGHGNRGRNTS